MTMIVESAVNGSRNAVSISGFSSISDFSIGCQFSIEEPSNGRPASIISAVTADIRYEIWCHVPLMSVNLKSTNSTSFSSQYL